MKRGIILLIAVGIAAVAFYYIVEYTAPVGGASGSSGFYMKPEATNDFSSAFDEMAEGLRSAGFDVQEETVPEAPDPRIQRDLGQSFALSRIKCLKITRHNLEGRIYHWSHLVDPMTGLPEYSDVVPWRVASFFWLIESPGPENIDFRDYHAFERVRTRVLKTYRNKGLQQPVVERLPQGVGSPDM